jgi:hypothetical protein
MVKTANIFTFTHYVVALFFCEFDHPFAIRAEAGADKQSDVSCRNPPREQPFLILMRHLRGRSWRVEIGNLAPSQKFRADICVDGMDVGVLLAFQYMQSSGFN